jgi:hypothetical protein
MRWEREGQGGDLRSAQDAGTIPYASTLNTINSSRNVGALIVAMSANYSFRYCFVASIQTPPSQKSVGASDAINVTFVAPGSGLCTLAQQAIGASQLVKQKLCPFSPQQTSTAESLSAPKHLVPE